MELFQSESEGECLYAPCTNHLKMDMIWVLPRMEVGYIRQEMPVWLPMQIGESRTSLVTNGSVERRSRTGSPKEMHDVSLSWPIAMD